MDKDKDENINKSANAYMNAIEAKLGLNSFIELIPSIVDMNKSIYDEMKKKGFNDIQAFSFSCQYTIAATCGVH